jgi:hypothetical protein
MKGFLMDLMDNLTRDQALLYVFLSHLHDTGALSVPQEELTVAVEEVSKRFLAVEYMVGHAVKDIEKDIEESHAEKQ